MIQTTYFHTILSYNRKTTRQKIHSSPLLDRIAIGIVLRASAILHLNHLQTTPMALLLEASMGKVNIMFNTCVFTLSALDSLWIARDR